VQYFECSLIVHAHYKVDDLLFENFGVRHTNIFIKLKL
jgi:hypothetical protein